MKKKWSNTIRSNKALFSLLLLLLIIALSSLTLLVNKGFHFSELNTTYVVRVEGEQVIDPFIELPNISQIDKANKEILLEHTSFGEVASKVEEIINDKGVNAEFVKVIERSANGNLQDILMTITIITFVVTIVSALLIYYSQRSLQQAVSFRSLMLTISISFSTVVVSTVFAFGTLSLLSRFYRIKIFDIQLLLIIPVFVSFIFFYTFSRRNLIARLLEFAKTNAYLIVLAQILLIVPLALGMGSQAVVPLFLIIMLLVETLIVLVIILNLNLSSIKSQLTSKKTKPKKVSTKTSKAKKSDSDMRDRSYKSRRKKNTKK